MFEQIKKNMESDERFNEYHQMSKGTHSKAARQEGENSRSPNNIYFKKEQHGTPKSDVYYK